MGKYLDDDKWLKKYKYKLVKCWQYGNDDHDTALKCGLSYEEYEHFLAKMPRLREIRDKWVDELRRICRSTVGEAIRNPDNKDHMKVTLWYLEHRDPEFGAKNRYEEVQSDDTVEERRKKNQEALDKFMASFGAKDKMFDGGR